MDPISPAASLITETAVRRLGLYLRRYRMPFLTALISGLLAYGFALTNKLVNHDEVHSLFSKGGTVTSGRWGLGALDSVFPNYSMPWIYGLMTIVLIAAAVCVLVGLFPVRRRLLQGLLAGCVAVFPSLTGLFGYMFTSCAFALAFLLAILAAALVQQGNKRYLLPAFACLVFSLSIYQSYVSVTAGLLVLVLIRRLLTGSCARDVLKQGVGYVLFLVVSLVAYYLCTQAVLKITGTELGDYAAGNFTFRPSGILKGAILAYRNFFRFFTEGFCGLIPTAFSRKLHLFLLPVTLGLLVLLACKRKYPAASLGLLAVLLALLPLAIGCMYMITAEESIHTLVLYSFITVYTAMVLIADLALEELKTTGLSGCLLNILCIGLAAVIVINIYIANEATLHLHLRYENAYAFYTSLAAEIRQQPDFDPNTRLAVVGTYQQPEFYTEQFEHIQTITGVNGFLPDSYSNQRFLEYYLGFPVPFASQTQMDAIRQSPEFSEMAVYPYYGSLRKIGDVLVVKLS